MPPGAGSPGLERATGSGQAADAEAGQSRSSCPDSCACCIPLAEGGGRVGVPKGEAAEFPAEPDIELFLCWC